MSKPILLDTFCKAGGAGMGYHLAGFEVIGVDIEPQKHYPFEFIQADAIEFISKHGYKFDVIHASPPCQEYTKASKQWRKNGRIYKDLIRSTRIALLESGKIYILENVPDSPLINPIILNGSCFGILVHRPRLFEISIPIKQPFIPVTKQPVKMGRPVFDGDIIQPVGHFSNVNYAKNQMGIDWMTRDEISQAIPPAYTKWLGERLIEILKV